ncbi:hypothetical protein PVAND_014673 [Polypedilum vanderplanki]|uniref:Uncharacterized protein n=1 Tax=Polypedilum vanderplanki TaxID=319348 RepID=A0A9J6BAD2_POLVA|nr:hypothetical protein PVAND_014673 [Polypedilum vanderplanki]
MKFIALTSFFILLLSIITPTKSYECLFLDVEVGYYGCEVLKDLNNQTDFITGKHENDRSDSDVTAIFVNAKNDIEFSSVFCKTFSNLLHLHIETLEIARRDDFKDCKRVTSLKIVGTEVFWLPEDTFSVMEDLRKLEIAANKIVYLPRDLLVYNRKLETVSFMDNKIEVIDIEFPDTLRAIDLSANQCIDRTFPSDKARTVEELNKIVIERCGSSTAKRVKELEKRVRDLQNNVTNPSDLKDDVVKVTGAAMTFAASIPHASFENENYKTWFVFLTCLCVFLIIGWAGTAFVLMRKLNDMAHGDHHYLVSMDANTRREFLEE